MMVTSGGMGSFDDALVQRAVRALTDSIKMTEDVIKSVVQRCLAKAMPKITEGKGVATGACSPPQ